MLLLVLVLVLLIACFTDEGLGEKVTYSSSGLARAFFFFLARKPDCGLCTAFFAAIPKGFAKTHTRSLMCTNKGVRCACLRGWVGQPTDALSAC